MKFTRVNHGAVPKTLDAAAATVLDKEGFTAVPVRWVELPSTQFYFSGHPLGQAPEKVRERFNQLKDTKKCSLKWSTTGIEEISHFDRDGLRIEFTATTINGLKKCC